MQKNAATAYKDYSTVTASKPQLLVMLYQRAVLDIERAELALESQHYEIVNDNLQHAQKIVRLLKNSLNPEGFKGAGELMSLYVFVEKHLVQANLKKDPVLIRECGEILRPLCEAWETVVNNYEATVGENVLVNMG